MSARLDPIVVRRKVASFSPYGTTRDALPVVQLRAPEPGPTVVVTANVHGDEVTGVAAVHRLDDRLTATLLRGTVVLYPSLNPRGLQQQQRVQPDDGVDLNRVFPGDLEGHGATRLAGALWADLASRHPDALVDLHADSAVSIPYVIVDRATHLRGPERERMDAAIRAMADASGLMVLHEYPDDQYVRFHLDRSLAGAMVNHANVPAVTLEVGPRRAVDPDAVERAADAVLRIVGQLGLVGEVPPPPVADPGGPWRRTAAPRVQSTGVFEPVLGPGVRFAAGDVLGTVRALDGTVREVVRAEVAGLVVSWSESAWHDARGVPGTLAVEESDR
jgi:predicted deacylase